jgi:recombination protein RecR
MEKSSSVLQGLVDALRVFPGVGPRQAQRMAYHLLQYERAGAEKLAQMITHAVSVLRHCIQCHTLTETETCATCADARRDRGLLCVVETPADQFKIEQTLAYKGMYFVLLGKLSPIEGIGPSEIHFEQLMQRVMQASFPVREVIVATSFTSTGEATAYAIGELLKNHPVKVTRLARGVPSGSELEYVDVATIANAVLERRTLD